MSDQQKPETKTVTGKGRPTPTPKQREAAHNRPQVGYRSKEARQAARDAQRAEREKARKLALAGDERYLLPRDRGPQRKIIRDVLDNRYTLIEGLMPLMVLFLLVTSFTDDRAKDVITVVMILALFAVSLEAAIINRKSAAKIREKLGEDTKLQRGNYFYTVTRGMQPRPLRLPKPGPRKNNKA
jgi:hypothetical protein